MIASLHGTIEHRESRAVVVLVGGIGFRVYVGRAVLDRPKGETIRLYTYHHVSSDAMDLYGFATPDELGLFQSMLKVSGVGPKSALSILSELPAAEVRQAIVDSDALLLTRIPGIGKKTAERIILELSGTLAKESPASVQGSDDALAALERLGYTRQEATEALRHVGRDVTDVRERLRAALRGLSAKP